MCAHYNTTTELVIKHLTVESVRIISLRVESVLTTKVVRRSGVRVRQV